MPARHTTVLILAFWLAATGWLFYRDIRPYVLPGAPPPFTINLMDEAEAQRNEGISWSIEQDQQTKGYAITRIRYDEQDDRFYLTGLYKLWLRGRFSSPEPDIIYTGGYVVTRDGELREFEAKLQVDMLLLLPTTLHSKLKDYVPGEVQGRVENGKLSLRAEASFAGQHYKQKLEPVAFTARGSLLNSMQPLNRLAGLRRGQHWQMPYVDPLSDILRAASVQVPILTEFAPSSEQTYLDAEVLREPARLSRNDGKEFVDCLVVLYRGQNFEARTYVGRDDDLVYQQEMTRGGETWRLVRQDPGSRINDQFEHPRDAK